MIDRRAVSSGITLGFLMAPRAVKASGIAQPSAGKKAVRIGVLYPGDNRILRGDFEGTYWRADRRDGRLGGRRQLGGNRSISGIPT
jgi:hypothetical protein